jgi:hypothetical protein
MHTRAPSPGATTSTKFNVSPWAMESARPRSTGAPVHAQSPVRWPSLANCATR